MISPKAAKWFKDNFTILLCAVIFVCTLAYIFSAILAGRSGWGMVDIEDEQWPEALVSAVMMLSIAGSFILVLMAGNIINLGRMKKIADDMCARSQEQADAIEACGDGIAILSDEGIYTYMNKAHAECYGYEAPSELVGKNWRFFYRNDRVLWFEKEVFPAFRRHGEWRGTSVGLKKDGTPFPQEVRLNRLQGGGMVCIVRDVSEKVRQDDSLKMIMVAVEAADDGIAIADSDNKLLFMNRSFLKIHGFDPYQREHYINKDWRHFYNQKGQNQINSLVLPTTILKGAWAGTLQVMRKDSTLFYGDASLTKLPNGTILGVMRDINERRAVEQEREELKDRLFQSQKVEAIGRLIQGMAHDFNNILAAIQGYSQLVWMEAPENSPMRANITHISESCLEARDLVEQLVAFGRRKDARSSEMDICKSIAEIQKSFDVMIGGNIVPVIDIHVGAAIISAQPTQIHRAILNMVQNAIEAMGKTPGKLAISLRLAETNVLGLRRYIAVDTMPGRSMASVCRIVEAKGRLYAVAGYILTTQDYYHLTVSDTGCGIAKEVLPNIFDPFFSTKKSEKGGGLGLFALLGTAISHGGAIIVETVPGEGTNVHLYLPKAVGIGKRTPNTENLDAA